MLLPLMRVGCMYTHRLAWMGLVGRSSVDRGEPLGGNHSWGLAPRDVGVSNKARILFLGLGSIYYSASVAAAAERGVTARSGINSMKGEFQRASASSVS